MNNDIEVLEAGFENAVERILRHEQRLGERGLTPDEMVSEIGRKAMVNTAREYAEALTAAYALAPEDLALQNAS